MPSTHSSLHYHVVFSTKNRFPQIDAEWRPRLHAYIGGTVRGLGGVALEIGGVADHVHLLLRLKPIHAVADIVREIKKASTGWAHEFDGKFHWQDGYGVFTVSRTDLPSVTHYIREQEEHHRTKSFQEEYLAFLESEEIEYDPKFLW